MCRILIIPSGMGKKESIEILNNMLGKNLDGVGFSYVKDGKFVTHKYPRSLNRVIKKKRIFLDHLPHTGPTICHIRAISTGLKVLEDTHPFIIGNGKKQFCLMHNGTFSEFGLVKLALSKTVEFQ